jgi:uncharacterized protein (TIGR02246 family)
MTGDLAMTDDRQAIQALHQKDMAASRVRDVATLLSLCSDDCVMLPPGEDPIVGREAIRESLERDLEQEQEYQITEYVHNFEEVKVIGEDHRVRSQLRGGESDRRVGV